MKHINGQYTQRYNRLNHTDGPLFRGRYKAILVDSDAYLIHLSKYIHLNPTEAKIVNNPGQYKWSSYEAYIRRCVCPGWLYTSEVYGQLNKHSNHEEHYQFFVENKGGFSQICTEVLDRKGIIESLSLIAHRLGDLCDEVTFVGGCITGLLITDKAAPDVRFTVDVDCIVNVITRPSYYAMAEKLRQKGFKELISGDHPICRWDCDGILIDVMPIDKSVLGFSNRWYKNAQERNFHPDQK